LIPLPLYSQSVEDYFEIEKQIVEKLRKKSRKKDTIIVVFNRSSYATLEEREILDLPFKHFKNSTYVLSYFNLKRPRLDRLINVLIIHVNVNAENTTFKHQIKLNSLIESNIPQFGTLFLVPQLSFPYL
jgi:hypothetical protein